MNAHFVNRNPTPAEALTRVKELSWLLDSANSITAELAARGEGPPPVVMEEPGLWWRESYAENGLERLVYKLTDGTTDRI